MRPTASAVAQSLFDILVEPSPESTIVDFNLHSDVAGVETSLLDQLSSTIKDARSLRESVRDETSVSNTVVPKIEYSAIQRILQANQDIDPTILALVGQAYLLDIVVGFEYEDTCCYTTRSSKGKVRSKFYKF